MRMKWLDREGYSEDTWGTGGGLGRVDIRWGSTTKSHEGENVSEQEDGEKDMEEKG